MTHTSGKRLMSVLLAGSLQLMPMLRAIIPLEARALPSAGWAWILKIAGGAVAVLGSYDSVSGATKIVAPYTVNATVGTPYNRQLTTSGQSASSWSASTGTKGSTVFPLTPGLWLTNRTGRIAGTPTSAGTSSITITAWENSNNSGGQVSGVFTFTIKGSSDSPPSISSQPMAASVNVGSSATFSVTATGTAPLTYQWRLNGTAISGATSSTYTKSNAQTTDGGNYSVVVANSAGSVTSADALLTVNVPATPPSITTQPVSQTLAVGSSASFSVTAGGTAPLSYQWQFNGTAISGATGSSYTKANVQATDAGTYTVVVTNPAGAVTSSGAVLTVQALSADLSASVTGPTNVTPGANFTYTITVANLGPDAASGVLITDQLPPTVTFVSAPGGSSLNNVVTWPAIASLANGQTTNLTITVTAPNTGSLTNTVMVSSTTADPNAVNNDGTAPTSQVATSVSATAPVSISNTYIDSSIPTDPHFVIEFTSSPGKVYTISYSDDGMLTWTAAANPMTASLPTTQWVDAGPPDTASKPFVGVSRFYRVSTTP